MRLSKCFKIVAATVFSTVLLFPALVSAEGRFVAKPLFNASWRFDDNFYRSENNEREVHTYLVQPGLDIGYETAESSLKLHYTLNAHFYDDADSTSSGVKPASDDDFVGHTGELNASTRFFKRLKAGLDESYRKTRNSAHSDRFSNSEERDKFWINRLSPWLVYDFVPHFSLASRYRHTKADFEKQSEWRDFDENRGIFDLIYRFSRLSSMDLEYQLWSRDYGDNGFDYTSNQAKLKYLRRFKYFAFEIGAGYHDRDFRKDTYDDAGIFTYRFAVLGQNPPAPHQKPKSRVMFSAEHNFNDLGDDFFTADRFTLEMGRLFWEKVAVTIGGYYQIADYENETGETDSGGIEKREDDYYVVYAGAGYEFYEWLRLSVKLGYEDRDSNLEGHDYSNCYFNFNVEVAYDLGSK
jgi:hypothetical protein